MKTIIKNLGKVVPTIENNNWSINNSYEKLTFVYDIYTNALYISKQDVPEGIEITNGDYWKQVLSLIPLLTPFEFIYDAYGHTIDDDTYNAVRNAWNQGKTIIAIEQDNIDNQLLVVGVNILMKRVLLGDGTVLTS